MKTLFTAEAVSDRGRDGGITDPQNLLTIALGNPLEPGAEKRGPSPELLFAGAYSACYHSALLNAARALGSAVAHPHVRALVSLLEDEHGAYRLAVELHAKIPGIGPVETRRIMEKAHETCPYSKAMRGDTFVTLVAD